MGFVVNARKRDAEATQRISRASASDRELIGSRYEVISLLGRGGMAEVFAAHDRKLERIVALKRPRREVARDVGISSRLQREAVALAMIDSPHVVAIHDVGVTPRGVYLVLQRLVGRTLDDELAERGPTTPARACRIARDILAGLTAVHAAGLVHRDLKAANVLIDPGGRAVLIDLGAALHPRRRPLTAPGLVLGTPGCMAPEQMALGAIDSRVDLFQLGLLLVHLLTGAAPGDAIDVTRLTAPRPVCDVVLRSLSTVEERFRSAAEMQIAVEDALAACRLEPIEPVEPAVPSRRTLRWPTCPPLPAATSER